jgi:hypothetical protein
MKFEEFFLHLLYNKSKLKGKSCAGFLKKVGACGVVVVVLN